MTRWLPYGAFAAITLATFWPVALGRSTWYPREEPGPFMRASPPHAGIADPHVLHPTNLSVYNEGLKHGELRLWNPRVFLGNPLYTDPTAHPFYPPDLLLHALLPPRLAFDFGLMLHLFFAGCAMYWLLRGLGRDATAATVGAIVWMIGGYGAIWFTTAHLLGASVFAPLTLLAIHRGLAAPAGVAMGMLILGTHSQHALHFFLLFAAWIAVRRNARLALWFVVISLGVGAAAILTRLETIQLGHRGAAAVVTEPWLFTRIADVVLGKARPMSSPDVHSECWVYFGALTSTLAVAGAVLARRDPLVRFATIVAIGSMLLAFAPVGWLWSRLPLMNLAPPARWLGAGTFCIAILAAYGAHAALPRLSVIVGAIAVAGAALLFGATGAAIETAIGAALGAGALLTSHAIARPALGAAALAVDLLAAFLHFAPMGVPTPEPAALRELRERDPGVWRVAGAASATQGVLTIDEMRTEPMRLAAHGAEIPGGFGAMATLYSARFAETAGAMLRGSGRVIHYHDLESPLVDAANVRYAIWPYGKRLPSRFRRIADGVYENTTALPRAWVVGGAMPVRTSGEARDILRSRDFRPLHAVVVEASESRAPGLVEHSVQWTGRTRLRVTCEADGFLVVADGWHPGWKATVDGAATPILRANLAFRAVAIARGVHDVEFRFRPSSARNGLVVTGIALAGALAWIIAGRAGRRGSLPDATRAGSPGGAAASGGASPPG